MSFQGTVLAQQQERKLVKALHRADVLLFIVAAVIGLDTIGTIAAGGLEALFWGIVLVITFMVPFAMLFAETGGAFPQEGGPYQWVKFAFGRLPAGITSVLYWITNPIWLGGSLVTVATTAFSSYVYDLKSGSVLEWVFKLGYVWASILLAIVSLKTGKIFVNTGAYAKMAVLAVMVLTTVAYGVKNGFQPIDLGSLHPSIVGFLAVGPVVLFSYVGFEAPNAASEEMFDPANDTAPAIRRGSVLAMFSYLLPVLAILLVVPADQVSGVDSFMGAVSNVFTVYGSAGDALLKVTALLFVYALVNQGSSWMMATDRIQAMAAADGTFFNGYFGEFNERFGTPLRVNILSGVMSTVFVVAAAHFVEGNAGSIFNVVLFCAISTLLVSYVLIVPALMVLKTKFPQTPRTYVVPGGVRGFQVLGAVVTAYIAIGSVVALFPGVLERALGVEYDYTDVWGTSRANVMGFTLGTFAVVMLIAVAGYAGAGRVRANLVTDATNDSPL